MNLTSKTPSKVPISIKGNFPLKTFEVLLVFHNLIYSRFIGQVESFNPKNKYSSKQVIKILKTGTELIQSKQQRYLNHAIFISTFDQM